MGSLAGLADLQKRAAADSPHIRRGSVIAGSLFAEPEESANCIRAVACHN
jgi:hypothetical protein